MDINNKKITKSEASENQKYHHYQYRLPKGEPPDVIVPIPIRPGGSNASQQQILQLHSVHMPRQFTFSEFKRKKSTQAHQSTALSELLQYKDSEEEKEGEGKDETRAISTIINNTETNPEMIKEDTVSPITNTERVPVIKNESAKDDSNNNDNKVGHKSIFNTKNAMELALRIANQFVMDGSKETHNPNRTKPFRCEVEGCMSTFTRKHDLKRHVNGIHKCEKLYQCPACLRNFSRKDAWKRHSVGCAPPTVETKNVQPIEVELRRKIVELIN
ncbi:11236_t:CDS:2 [Ambispora gerdemannii]|uniref:11236_t:CDS:1 n=1 Tax=Ambispora gerdemannii TaxID=144530 RepID=A0A9N9A2A1_9GLOM|nr:11236_t:CDS:2 [Ambispora gerdemannii]